MGRQASGMKWKETRKTQSARPHTAKRWRNIESSETIETKIVEKASLRPNPVSQIAFSHRLRIDCVQCMTCSFADLKDHSNHVWVLSHNCTVPSSTSSSSFYSAWLFLSVPVSVGRRWVVFVFFYFSFFSLFSCTLKVLRLLSDLIKAHIETTVRYAWWQAEKTGLKVRSRMLEMFLI